MTQPSRTPYAMLGCLTIEPMSGYDIRQFLERTVSHIWSESYGQIYPALRKLEEEGLIEGREASGERGQKRRVYRITDDGREQLKAWLRKPAQPVQPRYEHSLKLFFGHNVGPGVSLEHLDRLRKQTETDLDRYRAWEQELRDWAEREPESRATYSLLVLRGGVLYSEAVLEWCDESARRLRALQGSGTNDALPEGPTSPQEAHQ